MTSIVITHYDVLGVDATSSLQQLRRAYRAAAKAAHPDTGGNAEAFARVQHAWEQLRDPQRRAAYDRELTGDQRKPAGPEPTTSTPQPGGPRPEQRYVPQTARRRPRGMVVFLAITVALTGGVTTWAVAQLGRPAATAAGIFLTLSLGSLAARAAGLEVGRGTYRFTQRLAWLCASLLAAIAGGFWALERSDVVVPAAGAAFVAVYATAVAQLWRILADHLRVGPRS